MKKLFPKNKLLMTLIFIFSIFTINISIAQDPPVVDGFNIIPELTEKERTEANEKVKEIGEKGGHVMEEYRKVAASTGFSTSQQLATGIMNRNTILNYIVYVIQFLSQIGLLVGAVFIIYAGYKYMVSVFNNGKTPSSTITNAIIGVLIIIFSYAIMRILTSFIGVT